MQPAVSPVSSCAIQGGSTHCVIAKAHVPDSIGACCALFCSMDLDFDYHNHSVLFFLFFLNFDIPVPACEQKLRKRQLLQRSRACLQPASTVTPAMQHYTNDLLIAAITLHVQAGTAWGVKSTSKMMRLTSNTTALSIASRAYIVKRRTSSSGCLATNSNWR